jgi:hypothetical protein
MKKIQTLSLLLEQAELDGTKIELTGNAVTMTIKDKVRIKWPYQYSWPAKTPLLGDMENFVKALNASTKPAGKSILSQIEGSDKDKSHYVAIARNETSTQNNRLLRKDLGEVKGWVYLFYPNTIDETLVPDNKKLPSVDGRFTFIMDSEFKKYLKTGTPTTSQSGNSTKPDTNKITSSAFMDRDGKAYGWYNDENGIRIKYINRVNTKIGKSTVNLFKSSKITPIFWQFVAGLPEGLAATAPAQPTELELYSEDLQTAIKGLLATASKYDPENFSVVNTNTLTAALYSKMVNALIVIGLNLKKIDINFTPDKSDINSKPYYKSIVDGAAAAGVITDTPDANSNSSANATANFNGTAVNNETDLAKILSGLFVERNVEKSKVDSIEKVKDYWNSTGKSSNWTTLNDAWDNTVKSLPWKKGPASASVWFNYVQKLAIKKTGPYGKETTAGFLRAFNASAF